MSPAAPSPPTSFALEEAAAARRSLQADPLDREAYLELRRHVAAGAPYWRRAAATGAEVLLGPVSSSQEAGGQLALLDAAFPASRDEAVARRRAVELALTHIGEELKRQPLAAKETAQLLSHAAYDLGLSFLEATAGTAAEGDAVLADWRGGLDGLERGVDALSEQLGIPSEAPPRAEVRELLRELRAAVDDATDAHAIGGRGALVLRTGALGVSIRELARAHGVEVRLPYAPRVPIAGGSGREPVHALTVPGPRGKVALDAALVAAGARLFADPRLSSDQRRSCGTCHVPAKHFTDGRARAPSLDPTRALRNTPTLLYGPLFASQLWDGRVVSAERQALRVIHSDTEMGLSEGEIEGRLAADAEYRRLLAGAGGVTAANVARALVAWEMARLVPADAPIDRYARGDASALDAEELAGLDVFVGRGRCARCHVPPSFGGVRPRRFDTAVYAVVGAPSTPDGHSLEPDPGRGAVTRLPADAHAFKVPTVRNASRTGPYFHHGGFRTLDEVVSFYDGGGPEKLGFEVDNLDPDIRTLRLTPEDRRRLVRFMSRALLDETDPESAVATGADVAGFEPDANR